MNAPDHIRDLAAAYTLGALDAEDARQFEELLESSPDLKLQVQEYRELAALLALNADVVEPPLSLRERVMATAPASGSGITPIAAARPARSAGSWFPWLAAAAAIVLFAWTWAEKRSAIEEVARRDSAVEAKELAIASRDSLLANLLASDVTMYQLTSTGDPEPLIQLFWNKARGRAVLHALRLPQLATDRTYQLWFVHEGAPMPSVTFRTNTEGEALLTDITVPDSAVSAAAVTEEPSGGSEAPTTPILLITTFRQS